MTISNMALQVKPMLREDIHRIYEIRDAALLPSEAPISCLLFKGSFTATVHQREVERLEKDPSTIFLKVEGESGETVAIMRARRASKKPDANTSEIRIPPWRETYAVGPQAWDDCMRGIAELKAKNFENVPHICKLELAELFPSASAKSLRSRAHRYRSSLSEKGCGQLTTMQACRDCGSS